MHTPGPWSLEIEREKDRWGNEIGYQILIPEINRLLFDTEWADQDEWETCKANARLIAAAPDLLEALKHLLLEPMAERTVDAAKRAIAKAEGKQ